MNIEKELEQIALPKVYKRNGKDCFYDTYREKLIPVTPEEIIRQQVAGWCEKKLGTPNGMIIIEQHLSHYGVNTKDRADIVLHKETEDGLLPIAIIECKAKTVLLSDRTCEQCFRYADMLGADCAIVTNGVEILAFKYDDKSKTYKLLAETPTYSEMTNNEYKTAAEMPCTERPSMEEMMMIDVQQQYVNDYIIGSKTTQKTASYIINLLEALLDVSCTLTQKESKTFKVIEDLGVRILNYGNAAGYDYVAPYRSFLIKDKFDNHQIISVGFNAYGNDQTILCIAIDDYKKSHHSLQLLFDKYTMSNGNELIFYHNGKISVGHSGSGSANAMLNMVAEMLPDLYEDGKIVLGKIPINILLKLDQPATTELVLNLMEYSLLRDEYRAKIKGNKENKKKNDVFISDTAAIIKNV